jgi:hypothetical protein
MSSALDSLIDSSSSPHASSSPVSAVLDNSTWKKGARGGAVGRSQGASLPSLPPSLSSTDLSPPSQNPSMPLHPLHSTSPPLRLHRGHPANARPSATARRGAERRVSSATVSAAGTSCLRCRLRATAVQASRRRKTKSFSRLPLNAPAQGTSFGQRR